jgi:AcrR family transcriptional regulator
MVQCAAMQIGRHGVSATSFSELLVGSGAPRGSIYHHFPNGKAQLVEEAVQWVGREVLAHQRACEATTPAGVLLHFVALFRKVVRASKGTAGCAVAGVALDSGAEEALALRTVRGVFRSWLGVLSTQLVRAGLPRARAKSVATMALAAIEGGLILCRAEGGRGPLEAIARELEVLVPSRTSSKARRRPRA